MGMKERRYVYIKEERRVSRNFVLRRKWKGNDETGKFARYRWAYLGGTTIWRL